MPPQVPSAKVDELRARLRAEPKSRHFYPLGEELRRSGQLAEAEQVLRDGLVNHPAYLSAWVSFGRVLKEAQKHPDALDALNRAFSFDANNVVTARLLADTHLAMGDKVEAIKKYKLVHALLPSDEDVQSVIAELERELSPPVPEVQSGFDDPSALDPEPVAEGAAPMEQNEAAVLPDESSFDEAEESGQPLDALTESEFSVNDEEPAVAASPSYEESKFDDTADSPFEMGEPHPQQDAAPMEGDLFSDESSQEAAPPPEDAERHHQSYEETDLFSEADSHYGQRDTPGPGVVSNLSATNRATESEEKIAVVPRSAEELEVDFERRRVAIRRLQDWSDRMKGVGSV